ncbi:MAG: sugar O-acyltransferase [Bacteroidales bacterium]|jgi:sugar O-acyltransferase (sialic acid O-acetyltransferase NeuD family)|nr:sugar O-acyltransferase [Bacteroidales bacterium]
MNKKIIIIGGEGNGGVVASCIEDNWVRFNDTEWEVAGFLNDFEKGKTILGYPVLGGTDDIDVYLKEDYYFIYAIHMIGRNAMTEEVFLRMNIPHERLATIVHKTAFVAKSAVLEPGVFIMSNCYVGPGAKLGYCSLMMANSLLGHNTTVGPLCHFSVGSITSSYIDIGKVSDVALGARVLEKRKIGNYAVAGANSLITHDIPDYEIHIGSPATFLKKIRLD